MFTGYSPFLVQSAGSSDLSSIESAQRQGFGQPSGAPGFSAYSNVPSGGVTSYHQGFQGVSFRQPGGGVTYVPVFPSATTLQPGEATSTQAYQPRQEEQKQTVSHSFLGPPKETQQEALPSFSEYNRLANSILQSRQPLDLDETEKVTFAGETGIWANKGDLSSWKSPIALSEYPINDDPEPQIVRKSSEQQIIYSQELGIRYLRPPTPPPPGELIIEEEQPVQVPPAPDLVIRQEAPPPQAPEPIVIREAPPRPPPTMGSKVIRVPGKRMPPPPRRVIIERLPPLPPKPQPIIIERWLAYPQPKRQVIFKRAPEPSLPERPRNVVIQWDAPKAKVIQEVRDYGIVRANPDEYARHFGESLLRYSDLPDFAKRIVPPREIILASERSYEQTSFVPELTGDLDALKLVDLEREGLNEYKSFQGQTESREQPSPKAQGTEQEPVGLTALTPSKPLIKFQGQEVSKSQEAQRTAFPETSSRSDQATQVGSGSDLKSQQYQSQGGKEPERTTETQQKEPSQAITTTYQESQETRAQAKEDRTTIPGTNEWGIGEQLSHIHAQMSLGRDLKPVETPQKPEEQKQKAAPEQTTQGKSSVVYQVFRTANRNDDNTLSRDEALRLLKDINERLGRTTDENKCQRFLNDLQTTQDGSFEYESFKSEVINAIY